MRLTRRALNDRPGPQPPPSVQLTGATVTYGSAPGIADIDLHVDAGTFLAVTGASGAGKTTLLWAIAGTVPLTSGTVYVNGHEILDHSTAISRGVALIPQGNGLANVLTAHENIALTLTSLGHGPASTAARTSEALDLVGLTESSNHLIDELSGGQQQRVAVARALASRAVVILADEPTSDLDHLNRDNVLQLLRQRAEQGGIVIMATHDPEAAELSSRHVHLEEGRLINSDGRLPGHRQP
jgi:putative ABC transport system ATP-binding protein